MPHEGGSRGFIEVLLSFEGGGERLSLSVLDDYEEAVVVFEELIDFGHGEVVDFDEFVDLFLEHGSFVAADFVLVDDVDCAGEGGFEVNGLAELVELVLFETGGQQFVLVLDAALDFLDEVVLLELDLLFLTDEVSCAFVAHGGQGLVAHTGSVIF